MYFISPDAYGMDASHTLPVQGECSADTTEGRDDVTLYIMHLMLITPLKH